MIAAWTPTYGPADIIEIREVTESPLGPDQIRVQVHASPVTAGDLRLRAADFPGATALLGRLMMGVFSPKAKVQGTMFSGEVVEVGAEVERFAVGDAVFGAADAGAWAERLVVDAQGNVDHRPENLDDNEAASLSYGGGTVLHFLEELAEVKPGERVLILGGSGGVGRFAIQLARHLGAHVTAVGSKESLDLMRELGAHEVIDYRKDDFTQLGNRYDVVFDIADRSSFPHSRRSLRRGGRYLTLYLSFPVLFWMAWTRVFGTSRALISVAMGSKEATQTIRRLAEQGVFRPRIAKAFPLSQIGRANELAESGVHGSVLVHPSAESLSGRRAAG